MNDLTCDSSVLKTASRKTAQTHIITGEKRISLSPAPLALVIMGQVSDSEEPRKWYIINAGAIPKLTASARESSSFPMSEYAFRRRAEKPSNQSKIIAAMISHDAVTTSPLTAKTSDMKPAARLRHVMKFGICFILNENVGRIAKLR